MPLYLVEIREDSIRKFQVDAESPAHVKKLYEEDENQLGPAFDCNVFNSHITILTPEGTTLQGHEIADLDPSILKELKNLAHIHDIDSEQLYSAVSDSSDFPLGDDKLEEFGELNLDEQLEWLAENVEPKLAKKVIEYAVEF